jgi:hypothetical protein
MDIKGSPDTFDVHKLKETLALSKTSDVYWPVYSRAQHDVSDEGIQIKEKILLLEGNYLLLNCYPWNTLQKYADYSIFIKSDLSQLRKRLIDRKIQGGLDRAAAERFYEMSDSKNVELVLRESLPADLTLRMDHNANFSLIT